jgi:hypothetical protein
MVQAVLSARRCWRSARGLCVPSVDCVPDRRTTRSVLARYLVRAGVCSRTSSICSPRPPRQRTYQATLGRGHPRRPRHSRAATTRQPPPGPTHHAAMQPAGYRVFVSYHAGQACWPSCIMPDACCLAVGAVCCVLCAVWTLCGSSGGPDSVDHTSTASPWPPGAQLPCLPRSTRRTAVRTW